RSRRRPIGAEDAAAISALFDRLEAAIAPLLSLLQQKEMHAAQLATALWSSVEAVSAGAPLHGREEFSLWAGEMARLGGQGHRFGPFGLDEVLFALMSGFEVRNHE